MNKEELVVISLGSPSNLMSISIHLYGRDLQEEDATFDLQCSDSLSIFANGIGDAVFRIRDRSTFRGGCVVPGCS